MRRRATTMTVSAVTVAVLLLGLPGIVLGSFFLWRDAVDGVHRSAVTIMNAVDRRTTAAQPVQRDALLDAALDAGQQLVQAAADLAGVARDLAHAALVVVQLFQRDHRQEHVVLLEAEEGGGIVHQHVGVQHEQLVGRRLGARGAVPTCVPCGGDGRHRGVWPCRAGCGIGRAARRHHINRETVAVGRFQQFLRRYAVFQVNINGGVHPAYHRRKMRHKHQPFGHAVLQT